MSNDGTNEAGNNGPAEPSRIASPDAKLRIVATFDSTRDTEANLQIDDEISVSQLMIVAGWLSKIVDMQLTAHLMPRPAPLNREQRRRIETATSLPRKDH